MRVIVSICALAWLGPQASSACDAQDAKLGRLGAVVDEAQALAPRLEHIFKGFRAQYFEEELHEAAKIAINRAGDASDPHSVDARIVTAISAQELELLADAVYAYMHNTPEGRALHESAFSKVFAGGVPSIDASSVQQALEEVIEGFAAWNRKRARVRDRFPGLAHLGEIELQLYYNEPALRRELLSLIKRLANEYFLSHEFFPRIRRRARNPNTRLYRRVGRARARTRARQVAKPMSIYNRKADAALANIDTRALMRQLAHSTSEFIRRSGADANPTRKISWIPVGGDLNGRHNGFVAIDLNGRRILDIESPKKGAVSPDVLAQAAAEVLRAFHRLRAQQP